MFYECLSLHSGHYKLSIVIIILTSSQTILEESHFLSPDLSFNTVAIQRVNDSTEYSMADFEIDSKIYQKTSTANFAKEIYRLESLNAYCFL